jgi:hypothetical protein
MDAISGQGVEVDGEGCHQRFAFTRLHLGYLPTMKHHAAD